MAAVQRAVQTSGARTKASQMYGVGGHGRPDLVVFAVEAAGELSYGGYAVTDPVTGAVMLWPSVYHSPVRGEVTHAIAAFDDTRPSPGTDDLIVDRLQVDRFDTPERARSVLTRMHQEPDIYRAAAQWARNMPMTVGPTINGRSAWDIRYLSMHPMTVFDRLLNGEPVT